MWSVSFTLAASLAIILLSCNLFTNGIEWLGKKLYVGDGVVGSIFSAVGTCMPETIIPIIAIFFSRRGTNSIDIGIGAIVGAPFMLGTLAFFITGLGVLFFMKKRKTGFVMNANSTVLSRDIGFFIVAYSVGIGGAFFGSSIIKRYIALFLVLYYFYYIFLTVRQDNVCHGELDTLFLAQIFKTRATKYTIISQLLFSLFGIIFGAHVFVRNIEAISHTFGIPTLVLSMIITPIATELPEKFNSIIWISKKKDTLAMGNITGAMVFQSCIPVAMGIVVTSWELDFRAISSAILSIMSAASVYLWIKVKGKLNPVPLLMGGLYYTVFIVFLVVRGMR